MNLLLLVFCVFSLGGCAVSPDVSAEALSVGVTISILLRRMLADGTWPQRVQIKEPVRSLLAAVLGGLTATLMARTQGASWAAAEQAGFSGLSAILIGLVEKGLPQQGSAAQGSTAQGASAASSSGGPGGGVTGGGAPLPPA